MSLQYEPFELFAHTQSAVPHGKDSPASEVSSAEMCPVVVCTWCAGCNMKKTIKLKPVWQ